MPTIRQQERIIAFKIVYCGAALSGKTTNVQHIHSRLDPAGRGELIALSTAADRTLFFDFMSVETNVLEGWKTLFQLYTVPGQVTYNATMQLVLKQADGIVFVADSQADRQRDNLVAWQNMESNLKLNGAILDDVPLVIQYNKRDLPSAVPVEYLEYVLNNKARRHVSYEADAAHGRNVLATLNAVSQMVLSQFQQRMDSESIEPEIPVANITRSLDTKLPESTLVA
jgi:mutual gliding-motility protein MglA